MKNIKNNLIKKKEIDKVFNDFVLQINEIKNKRNIVVYDFLNTLKEKYIEELKKNPPRKTARKKKAS